MRGLSISARHWCNNLGVFPLCAGVIVRDCEHREIFHGVSPACGGYRRESVLNSSTSACFPCVRGLSAVGERAGSGGFVFPLCAGVIGRGTCTRRVRSGVSPAWGLSVPLWFRDYFHLVFPLCGGYRLVRNPAFHRR